MGIHKVHVSNASITSIKGSCEIRREYDLPCRNCEYREICCEDEYLLKYLNETFSRFKERKPYK